MQSETQTVRKDILAHPLTLEVRHQSAIDATYLVADDAKTFRIAVVIGLVMVGGLSLFLPDQAGRPTYGEISLVSLESLDPAQEVKRALSILSERVHAIQANIVELRQGNETFGHPEIRAQLATLAPVVPSPEVVKRQARTSKANPVVRIPPFQTDAVSLQR